jgi:hypothetical protein
MFKIKKGVPILLAILVLMAGQCSSDRESTDAKAFRSYLTSLDVINVPFEFNSKKGLKGGSVNYDTALFAKFKHSWSARPYGRFEQSDSITKIIEVINGDIPVPVLMTYNQNGVKLDSLNPFDTDQEDFTDESNKFVSVNGNDIIIIDSLMIQVLDNETGNVMEGMWSLSVDTTIYQVASSGKISKIKD